MVETLLRDLEALGIEVSAHDGKLALVGDVPPDLLEQARKHKAEMLLHLAGGNNGNAGNSEDKPALIRRYRVTLVDGKSFTALATAEQDEEADRTEFALHWGTRLLLLERVS